jgi:ATP-binding cassette, subfamily B, bacterial
MYIISYFWKHCRINMITAITVKCINSLLPVISIVLFERLINEIVVFVQEQKVQTNLLFLFVLLIIVFVIPYALNHVININDQYINNKITFVNSKILLEKVSKIDYINFEKPIFYNDFQRVLNNREKIIEGFNSLIELSSSIISIITLSLYLLTINVLIVIIIVIGIIPFSFVHIKFTKNDFLLVSKLVPITRKKDYYLNLLSSRESLKEVRLFNAFNFIKEKWQEQFLKYSNQTVNFIIKRSKYLFISELFIISTYITAGVIVIVNLSPTTIAGSLVATLQSIQLFQSTITGISRSFANFKSARIFINDFLSFLNTSEEIREDGELIEKISTIEFNDFFFKYPDQDHFALKGINLRLETKNGEKIAIVGENGCGKSTLVKCLLGLYTHNDKGIYINNVPISKINLRTYQSRISILFQDFIKYEMSAKDNIALRYIENDYDEKNMIDAATTTGINYYIQSLYKRYDTQLGRLFEGGQELSGGQWQKIAASRSIFKKGDLLILDEPTSSLDPISEKELFQNLINNYSGSILFITHRLGVASLADKIVVMKNGKITEIGSHEELMNLGGYYKKLYDSQLKYGVMERYDNIV